MSWMQTYHGNRFYPDNVPKSTFMIEDVAHALSNLCRFGGHTKHFYSVAQHSILVADIVRSLGGTPDQELWALMHDATEAYLVDVPTPVKSSLVGYKEKEEEVMGAIQRALKLPRLRNLALPKIVKQADGIALITEALQLVSGDVSEWDAFRHFEPHPVKIRKMTPLEARQAFLDRWRSIQSRRRVRRDTRKRKLACVF